MPSIVVSNPKVLSDAEFKAIQGSELHATMVKNRSVITVPKSDSTVRSKVRTMIVEWLKGNCNSFYHVPTNTDPILVYIEGDPDAVNFKLYFHDAAAPEIEVPAPSPPSVPIVNKPRISPRSTPSVPSDFNDMWDHLTKTIDDQDKWRDEYDTWIYPGRDLDKEQQKIIIDKLKRRR